MSRPGALREAVLKDVHQYLGSLEESRGCVEACEDLPGRALYLFRGCGL